MKLIRICSIVAVALVLATTAAAQNTSVSGQIIAPDGTPWVDLDVIIQNTDTGQHFHVKTDKDGRYNQQGLPPGVYKITIYDRRRNWFNYSELRALRGTQENDVSANFSKNIETVRLGTERKTEEEDNRFNDVKAHLNAGIGAMYDADTMRARVASAATDQKGPLQGKLNSDYKTAIREFQLAEQADPPTDTKNHAMIWAQLGDAYDYAGQFDDAVNAYQKAITLRPEAQYFQSYYQDLSKAQVDSALAQTDAKNREQKLSDANAACDKAEALDPAAARCWKNIGILLSNQRDMKDAITPLQKTTQLNPKDAQAWLLLGRALLSAVKTNQVGNQIIAVFPPGTAEAFQKCIDADPSGPYASEAKELLDGLASASTDEKMTVVNKNRK